MVYFVQVIYLCTNLLQILNEYISPAAEYYFDKLDSYIRHLVKWFSNIFTFPLFTDDHYRGRDCPITSMTSICVSRQVQLIPRQQHYNAQTTGKHKTSSLLLAMFNWTCLISVQVDEI